jgi:hypothetical protein
VTNSISNVTRANKVATAYTDSKILTALPPKPTEFTTTFFITLLGFAALIGFHVRMLPLLFFFCGFGNCYTNYDVSKTLEKNQKKL